MYQKSWSYPILFLRYGMWRMQLLFFILGYFLPVYPLAPPKMKKTHGDIIILHKCTKNHDHMLYCSWDMACDTCNCYFSFWAIFPFYPPPHPFLTAQKMKISKKKRKQLLEISFYTSVPKIMIVRYTFQRHGAWRM